MKSVWVVSGLLLGGFAVLAGTPWTLRGASRLSQIATTMSQETGLTVRFAGPVTLKLLPRPRVQVSTLSIGAADRSIELSAASLSGELDIGALIDGRWRLASATLSSPTGTIDVDAASRLVSATPGPAPVDKPFRLSVRSGVFRLVSRRIGSDTVITDVGATTERAAGLDGSLSASGSAVWRGLAGQFAFRLGQPARLAQEQQTSASLQITGPASTFSAFGALSGGPQPQFTGQVSASSAAPGRLFAALGLDPFCMTVRKLSLSGDVVARVGDLSLSDAALRLNSNTFEGTLGYHTDGGRGLIEGTLAANRFDLSELFGLTIDHAAAATLYDVEFARHRAPANLDLRVSAGEVVLGDTKVGDVALSLLSHDQRVEMTLDEALAFGGVVKARVIASARADEIETHAEMSVADVDLGPLGVALSGDERMTGILAGQVAVDGRGSRLRDIVPTLMGDGRVTIENGTVMGMSVSQALKHFTRRLPPGADQPGRLTAFATASSDMKIVNGTVRFVDGKLTGPGLAMAFEGQGDLPRGQVSIVAVASQTDAAGSPIAGSPGLPFEMKGSWGSPLIVTERGRHLPLPALVLPDLGTGQILP